MSRRTKLYSDRSNRYGDMAIFRFFQVSGRPPSWICDARVWAIHERHFGGLYRCAKFMATLRSRLVIFTL